MTRRRSGPEAEVRPLLSRVIEAARAEARALPPLWAASDSDLKRFSRDKSLYGYQRAAVDSALWALWLYYEKCDVRPDAEESDALMRRKEKFAEMLRAFAVKAGEESPERYSHNDEDSDPAVYAALSERIRPSDGVIPFSELCNRMGFWMATGSGKTLVMVKLIENLRRLMGAGKIPRRKILILAPGALLLGQIHEAVAEYNRAGHRRIDLVSLREWNTLSGDDAVFYYDAANISDCRKQVLVDWRDYDSDGEWYVLLDEAHRGMKADSKRQAYYALLARKGFLFNFSATFAEPMDVCMTGARFNLGDFISEGYGKHLRLCGADFRDFANRMGDSLNAFAREDYGDAEKRRVVLKSALALALVKEEIARLRAAAEKAGVSPPPYHDPLMVTMTHSVNTPHSDLAAYFKTLTGLASPDGIDAAEFHQARDELAEDLRGGGFQYESTGGDSLEKLAARVKKLSAAAVRRAVFLTDSPGALEIVKGKGGKEIAIQLRTASEPFGLIRIGETRKWIKSAEEAGVVVGETVRKESYFKQLEASRMTTLMGSRAFVESWDSARPNVLNFVNIGKAKEAVKFIVQSIGRGVRVRPLPDMRRRVAVLGDDLSALHRPVFADKTSVAAAETLFIFAATRAAVAGALRGLAGEEPQYRWSWAGDLFHLNPRPRTRDGEEMPLLVPKYKDIKLPREKWRELLVTKESERWIQNFVTPMPLSVLATGYGIPEEALFEFRALKANGKFWRVDSNGEKFHSPLSAIRGVFEHLRIRADGKKADGARPLHGKDIVHFQQVEIAGDKEARHVLRGKISGEPGREITKAEDDWRANKIDREEFRRILGRWPSGWEKRFPEVVVRNLAEHYYAPLVAAAKAGYIRHVVTEESEAEFLAHLADKMHSAASGWDAWMFSKLDAATDRVFIPYRKGGALHEFHPDFVFWMCRGDEYRIVFVDPKGTAFAEYQRKVDGYAGLFEEGGKLRPFKHGAWRKVTVALLLYNPSTDDASEKYRRYWTSDPSDIFAD